MALGASAAALLNMAQEQARKQGVALAVLGKSAGTESLFALTNPEGLAADSEAEAVRMGRKALGR